MPSTFEKTRKAIAKKKGPIEAVHQYSRDHKRLHRAQGRDVKLTRIASARKKADQPFIDRATFFQEAVRQNDSKPLETEVIQELVKTYVGQFDEELSNLKKARRPGRPSSAKEDLMKIKVDGLTKEYERGFLVPDLTTADNILLVDRWEGSWSYLTTVKWVRMSSGGKVQPASFPPRGDH